MFFAVLPLIQIFAGSAGLSAVLRSIKQDNRGNTFVITKTEAVKIQQLADLALSLDANIVKSGFDSKKIGHIVSIKDLNESAKYTYKIKQSCDSILDDMNLLGVFKNRYDFFMDPYDAEILIREFVSDSIKLFIVTITLYSRKNIQTVANIIRSHKYSKATLDNFIEQYKKKILKLELKEDQQKEEFDQVKEKIRLLEEYCQLKDNEDEEQVQSDSEEAKEKEDESPYEENNSSIVGSAGKDFKDTLKAKVDGTIGLPVKLETLNEDFLRKVYKEFKGDLLAPEGKDHPTSEEAFLYYLGFNEDWRPTEDAIYIHGDSKTLICFMHHLIVREGVKIPIGKWQSLARVLRYFSVKDNCWTTSSLSSIRNGYAEKKDSTINKNLEIRFNKIKI